MARRSFESFTVASASGDQFRCGIYLHSATYTGSVAPDYSDDGVDLTLIRWMLSLTPAERLAVLQDQVDSLLTLRAKFDAAVPRNTSQ